MTASKDIVVYANKRQLTLYFATFITVLMPVFTTYMIFSDYNSFMEEFSSETSAYFWTAFMLIASNILLVIMLWLHNRYVLNIDYVYSEDTLFIKTWSIYGFHPTKKYPLEILKNSKFKDGYTNIYGTPMVNAPWLSLKTAQKKTLVIDLQGELNFKFLQRLINSK